MRILFLAYASEPGAGSEYGVGWMVPPHHGPSLL